MSPGNSSTREETRFMPGIYIYTFKGWTQGKMRARSDSSVSVAKPIYRFQSLFQGHPLCFPVTPSAISGNQLLCRVAQSPFPSSLAPCLGPCLPSVPITSRSVSDTRTGLWSWQRHSPAYNNNLILIDSGPYIRNQWQFIQFSELRNPLPYSISPSIFLRIFHFAKARVGSGRDGGGIVCCCCCYKQTSDLIHRAPTPPKSTPITIIIIILLDSTKERRHRVNVYIKLGQNERTSWNFLSSLHTTNPPLWAMQRKSPPKYVAFFIASSKPTHHHT